MRRTSHGFTLIELLGALAALTVAVLLTAPPLLRATASLRIRIAAEELVVALRHARSLAVRASANVALDLQRSGTGGLSYAFYRDGDGDGVLRQDIRSGIDPQIGPTVPLVRPGRDVRLGLPPDRRVRDPGDPRGWLDRQDDPVRFNRSDLASFDPLGTATPGSVYLWDGEDRLVAVRVFGRTGKVKILTYDFAAARWR
jgi:prepilin-type N-terminal cleavage/methylation domain-containing protein